MPLRWHPQAALGRWPPAGTGDSKPHRRLTPEWAHCTGKVDWVPPLRAGHGGETGARVAEPARERWRVLAGRMGGASWARPVPTHATHSQTCISSCETVFFSLAPQCTPEVPRCPQPGGTHSAALLQGLRCDQAAGSARLQEAQAPVLLCHTSACDNSQGSSPARCHSALSHRRLRAQSEL